jgi:hypothetical protein
VIKRPWPSILRTIWGDNERYLKTYWEKFQYRYYVAGDSARRDKDGYYWIMGRIDDVLNVAGHRLGTMEIESALVAHPQVAESAVVSKPHDIKGESVFAYVVLNVPRPEGAAAAALVEELRAWVAEQLSPIAKPDEIRLTDNLPKTRSGKIMRRLLRSIARGEEITQDVSTLENPAILEQLRGGAAAPAAKAVASPTAPRPAAAAPLSRKRGIKTVLRGRAPARQKKKPVRAAAPRKKSKSIVRAKRKRSPGVTRAKAARRGTITKPKKAAAKKPTAKKKTAGRKVRATR